MRNWRVRWKLVAVVVVPTIATVALAGAQVAGAVSANRSYDRVVALSRLGGEVTNLVHELQKERDLASGYIGSSRNIPEEPLKAQQRRVEDATLDYLTAADDVDSSYSDDLRTQLQEARDGLAGLAELHDAITNSSLTRSPIIAQYSAIISRLLDLDAGIAEEADSRDLANAVRVLDDFSRAKEFTSQVRGELYATLQAQSFAIGQFEDFVGLVEGAEAAIEQFRADASLDDEVEYADTVRGQDVSQSQRMVNSTIQEARGTEFSANAEEWWKTQSSRVDLMREVEVNLLSTVVSQSEDLRSNTQRDALIAGMVLLGVLLIAGVATYFVARSMTRPLRLLRSSALEVADRRLPEVIERLRRPDAGNLGDIRVEPTGIESRDEIGEVAQAFDAVHREAVRLASDQAQLRQSVNAMFVNLSRRSQGLVERQLRLIDELESGEQNPDQLENLFKLDHLATRMRRTDDSLLVLAGSETGRGWSQPMPLPDVLLAAISEVEQYTRITRTTVTEASVIGYAVSDVVHLLAELMENATAFSPPETTVTVSCRKLSGRGGAMIEIEDHGIGMTAEELESANARLAAPPIIDVAVVRTMGLFVVGRLANKHNIRVQLRGSPHSGLTALVLLPPALVADASGEQVSIGADAGARIGSHAQANQDAQSQPGGYRHNGMGGPGGVELEPQNLEPSPIFDSVSEWFRHRRRIDHETVPPQEMAPRMTPNNHGPQQPHQRMPGGPQQYAAQQAAQQHQVPPQRQYAQPTPPPATHHQQYQGGQYQGSQHQGSQHQGGQYQQGPGQHQGGQYQQGPGQHQQGPGQPGNVPPLPRRSPEAVRPPGPHGPGPRGPQAPQPQTAPPQQPAPPPEPAQSWTSPADAGWRAAEAASTPSYERMTAAGLPVRNPRAHLIPGSANTRPELATPQAPQPNRSPENVRSMLSTYYSSYRRGRTGDSEATGTYRGSFGGQSPDDQEGS